MLSCCYTVHAESPAVPFMMLHTADYDDTEPGSVVVVVVVVVSWAHSRCAGIHRAVASVMD